MHIMKRTQICAIAFGVETVLPSLMSKLVGGQRTCSDKGQRSKKKKQNSTFVVLEGTSALAATDLRLP